MWVLPFATNSTLNPRERGGDALSSRFCVESRDIVVVWYVIVYKKLSMVFLVLISFDKNVVLVQSMSFDYRECRNVIERSCFGNNRLVCNALIARRFPGEGQISILWY